jgi:4-hydroxy-L-threonine phosphate dehydrogenase PdxA
MQKRKQKSADYSHGSHTHWVLERSKAQNTAMNVLQALCRRASFHEPLSKLTKLDLQEMVNADRKSIQRALRFLHQEGSIKVVAGAKGGRGTCPTYELVIIPLAPGEEEEEALNAVAPLRSERVSEAVARILRDNRGMSFSEARSMAEDEID